MANKEQLDLLKQGVEHWNQWKQKHLDTRLHLILANPSEAKRIRADLNDADLNDADLSGADLSGANLMGADLDDTDLMGADLSGADLGGADLIRADLSGANLTSADLSSANLTSADLSGANLREADLRGSNLSFAGLSFADLSRAYLGEANLREADLREAYLKEAYLGGVNFRGADFSGADLRGADFSGADLRKVYLWGTVFAENDLCVAKGILEIDHQGPSHVELYTVKLPQDDRAFHFLRGTGVPDEWIDFYRTQILLSTHYHSCFICYSRQDESLARRLYADLQNQGVRCWFAPEDMKIGDKIRARIDEAIHHQDKLLVLLSKPALASTWVEDEVEAALEKEERQQREVLFPVRLDEEVMQTSQAWATKLRRTRHIGDFTEWTDLQAYQQAFQRLLRDLSRRTPDETHSPS